jgi:hypothetical protein
MRNLQCDFSLISDVEKVHPGWNAFKEEMRDKEYGRESLKAAWQFYKAGWTEGWINRWGVNKWP